MNPFPDVKMNFGFGCMRLPMPDGVVDYAQCMKMLDTFMAAGFNYFDTAHGYMDGQSEVIIQKCITSRYPRDSYVLTNKLSNNFFNTQAEIRPLFEQQLAICGVDYFDFYLMHSQTKDVFAKYKACRAYETAFELKAEGKIRHVGLSFHDKAVVLDQILTEYPDIEVVQIQFNYADYDDPSVEGRKVYEVCLKHNKPVIVMEPVKGGCLVNLPEEAKQVFDQVGSGSYASYAMRFAAGFPGIFMVLSGMSTQEMVEDNVRYMADFKPLSEVEQAAVRKVCNILKCQNLIPCTACKYCLEVCPQNIPIPDAFACLNGKKSFQSWNPGYYYSIHTQDKGKASDCIECGQCEAACPQHLPIRDLLKTVVAEFEENA